MTSTAAPGKDRKIAGAALPLYLTLIASSAGAVVDTAVRRVSPPPNRSLFPKPGFGPARQGGFARSGGRRGWGNPLRWG